MEEANVQVRRFYETSDDTAYDVSQVDFELPKDPQEYADRLLLDKLALVRRHYQRGAVLDLCCATGQCLLTLAPSIDRGFGLDFSHRYIKAAANYGTNMGIRNLAFVQGDAMAIPFKSGQFEMLYCFSSLYAMPQVQPVITEIARVLCPDGIAVLDFGNRISLNAYCSSFYADWPPIYPIPVREMKAILSHAQLRVVEHRSFQILPLWADRPRWLVPLLHPRWKGPMSRRFGGRMLDEWISSIPGLRSLSFRHLLVCKKD